MTLLCILGMNDFIKGKEFEEGTSEPGGGGEGWGTEGKGAVGGGARLGRLPMMLPTPGARPQGLTDFPTGNVYDCVSVLWAGQLD